jgi:hypothetical protein
MREDNATDGIKSQIPEPEISRFRLTLGSGYGSICRFAATYLKVRSMFYVVIGYLTCRLLALVLDLPPHNSLTQVIIRGIRTELGDHFRPHIS